MTFWQRVRAGAQLHVPALVSQEPLQQSESCPQETPALPPLLQAPLQQASPLQQSPSDPHDSPSPAQLVPLLPGLPELTQEPPLHVSPVLQSLSCVH
jgi:hypothetical protein